MDAGYDRERGAAARSAVRIRDWDREATGVDRYVPPASPGGVTGEGRSMPLSVACGGVVFTSIEDTALQDRTRSPYGYID